jgi:hypothetical protein
MAPLHGGRTGKRDRAGDCESCPFQTPGGNVAVGDAATAGAGGTDAVANVAVASAPTRGTPSRRIDRHIAPRLRREPANKFAGPGR